MKGLYDDCETKDADKCDVTFTEKPSLFVDESLGEPPLLVDDVSLSAGTTGSTHNPSYFESEELLTDDVSVPPVDDDVSVQSLLDRHESLSTSDEEEWKREIASPLNDTIVEIGKTVVAKKVAKKVAKEVAKKVTKKRKFDELLLLDRHESLFTPDKEREPRDNAYHHNDTSIEIARVVVNKRRRFEEALSDIGKRTKELVAVYKRPSTMDRATSPSSEGENQPSITPTTAVAPTEYVDTVLPVPNGLEDTASYTTLEPSEVKDIGSEEDLSMYEVYKRFYRRRMAEMVHRKPRPSPFTDDCYEPLPLRQEHPRRVTLDDHYGF